MAKLVFNFFDNSVHKTQKGYLETFCNHFNIDYDATFERLIKLDSTQISFCDLAKILQLDLTLPTDKSSIICKHITTCTDNLLSVKSLGLITLSQALILDTPLKNFLLTYGIEIDAVDKKIIIKNKSFDLLHFDEKCNKCIYKKSDCLNCFCEFHQEISMLHSKLYHDKGEVEFFLSGKDNELAEYQSVQKSPEILWNIGKILNTLYRDINEYYFVNEWSRQKNIKRYIIEFVLPLNALELNNKSKNYFIDNANWFSYAGYNYEQYLKDEVSLNFYLNKILVETFFYKYFWDKAYYGQCIPAFHIKSNGIKIYKFENI